MNTHTTDQPIPREALKLQGFSSEEDFLEKSPKVFSIIKSFYNSSQKEQEIFLKMMELWSSEDERVKDLIKDCPEVDLRFIAKSMVENNRSIDDLFTMAADGFFNLEE